MALSPHKFRELVFQLLYSRDHEEADLESSAIMLRKELGLSKTVTQQAHDRVLSIAKHLESLDKNVAQASDAYDWIRIPLVERNVLRLGLYELLVDDTIPPKVAISEALRLTRKFSTPEAAAFVNAVIDHIYKQQQGEATDSSDITASFDTFAASAEAAREAGEQETPCEKED